MILTSVKRDGEESFSPEGINFEVRFLGKLMFIAMIGSGGVDPDQILVDPSMFKSADNAPSVELLWFTTTTINAPTFRDVVKEERILEGMRPNMFDSKLWPSDEVNLLHLGFREQLLVTRDNILKKVERGVVKSRNPHVLQEEIVRIKEGYLLPSLS